MIKLSTRLSVMVSICLAFSSAYGQGVGSEAEFPPVKIRAFGIGDLDHLHLTSNGFQPGASIMFATYQINGPATYIGPSKMALYAPPVGEAAPKEISYINLPSGLSQVLLVAIKKPGVAATRFIALPDHYGSAKTSGISLVNLTSMPLLIRLEDETLPLARGQLARHELETKNALQEFNLEIDGQRGQEPFLLLRDRVRMLKERDLTIFILGQEIIPGLSEDEIRLKKHYQRPLLNTSDRISTKNHTTTTIIIGEPTNLGGAPENHN